MGNNGSYYYPLLISRTCRCSGNQLQLVAVHLSRHLSMLCCQVGHVLDIKQ